MNVIVVYAGRVICRGSFAQLPRVNDFVKANDQIARVEAVMFDCTDGNHGEAIIYLKDVMDETTKKLQFSF